MELKGYSGCRLEIIDNDGNKYVRKKSSGFDYNQRLIEQKRKQSEIQIGSLHNCQVFGDGYIDGLYYFDMEYINGITLADYMESIELSDIERLVKKLTGHYGLYTDQDEGAGEVFHNKVISTKQLVFDNPVVEKDNSILLEAIRELEEYPWNCIVSSPCHGDMTLENILTNKEGDYLIDFLDSFYDTWLIDAAKLLQDAEYYWSYRSKPMTANLKVRLLVFRDLCIEHIIKMKNGRALLDSVYHILLLNILRIFPYTKNTGDYMFLIETTSNINKKVRGYGL